VQIKAGDITKIKAGESPRSNVLKGHKVYNRRCKPAEVRNNNLGSVIGVYK